MATLRDLVVDSIEMQRRRRIECQHSRSLTFPLCGIQAPRSGRAGRSRRAVDESLLSPAYRGPCWRCVDHHHKPNGLLVTTALLLPSADAACGASSPARGGLQVEYDAHGGVVNITDGALTHAADGTVHRGPHGAVGWRRDHRGRRHRLRRADRRDGPVELLRERHVPGPSTAPISRPSWARCRPSPSTRCRDLTDVTFDPHHRRRPRRLCRQRAERRRVRLHARRLQAREQCAARIPGRAPAAAASISRSRLGLTVAIDAFLPEFAVGPLRERRAVHPRAFHGSGLPHAEVRAVTVRGLARTPTGTASIKQPQTYFARVPGNRPSGVEGPHGSADAQPLTVTSNALSAHRDVRSPQTTGRWADQRV